MDQTLTRPPLDATPHRLQPRQYGAVNWVGLWALCLRETRRFWKVGMQTLFAPVVSSLLMLFVFKLAFGQGNGGLVGGVPFETFLASTTPSPTRLPRSSSPRCRAIRSTS
jgi:hypothetical protein